MRVLYVDDDRINTLLFEETCRFAGGLEVLSAATGAEALELVAAFQPEVLVLDLHLPDTDGYALLPALRQANGSATTPAFLCTADEPADVAQAAQRAGFQGCWTKPVDLNAVLADLAQVLPPGRPA
jgi:two-component system, OmpR family, response regulator